MRYCFIVYIEGFGLGVSGLSPVHLSGGGRLRVVKIISYKLGLNQNYYTFTVILLIKIVVCSKFP